MEEPLSAPGPTLPPSKAAPSDAATRPGLARLADIVGAVGRAFAGGRDGSARDVAYASPTPGRPSTDVAPVTFGPVTRIADLVQAALGAGCPDVALTATPDFARVLLVDADHQPVGSGTVIDPALGAALVAELLASSDAPARRSGGRVSDPTVLGLPRQVFALRHVAVAGTHVIRVIPRRAASPGPASPGSA